MSATPRPWRKSRSKSIRSVDEFGGFHVAQCRTEDDADLIVRVVETHDELVAALEDSEAALQFMCEAEFGEPDIVCVVEGLCASSTCAEIGCLCDKRDRIHAALAKARGEPA